MHTAKSAKLPNHSTLALYALAGALLAATAILCVHNLDEAPPAEPPTAKIAAQEQVITIPAPKPNKANKAPTPRCNPEVRARSIENKTKSKTSEPVRIDDALEGLNAMQRKRNARHGCPEHPSDDVIEQPLAPGEKMVVDVDKHDIVEDTNELEVLQLEREKRRIKRERIENGTYKKPQPIIFWNGTK